MIVGYTATGFNRCRVDTWNKHILLNNDAPAEQTRVNDEPVPHYRDLRDGDRIQLGNILLRFQMREARGASRSCQS